MILLIHFSLEKPYTMNTHVKSWLQSNIPVFNTPNFEASLRTDTMYGLLYGMVQSGKSSAQCGVLMYNAMVKKQTTIWILRNSTADIQQAIINIRNTFGDESWKTDNGWLNYAQRMNLDCDNYLQYLYNGDKGKKNRKKIEKALKIGEDYTPRVIVCMANHAQLNRLCKEISNILENGGQVNFSVVVDEVDEIGVDDNRTNPKRNGSYDILKENAKNVLGVSATNFNLFFGDYELKTTQLFRLIPSAHYKGIDGGILIDGVLEQDSKYSAGKSILHDDREMIPYIDELSSFSPFECTNMVTGHHFRHPIISLFKFSNIVHHHEEFVKMFQGNVHNFEVNWVVISYDGQGVMMYHPDFHNENFYIRRKVDGQKVYPTPSPESNGLPLLCFDDVHIGDVLEFLRKRDTGVEKYTHIAIVSGMLASRGINYVSNNYGSGINNWHLSHMYYKPSSSTDCTSHIQSMRILGNFCDNLPISLRTHKYVKDDLIRAYQLQEKIVNCCLSLKDTMKLIPEFAREIEFKQDEIPKTRPTKKLKIDLKVEVDDVDREWGVKKLRKNIINHLRAGRETIVIRILQFLLQTCPNGIATKEEIMTACDFQRFTDFTEWTKKHGRYQLVIPSDSNNWKLNPEVVDILTPEMMNLL